MNRVIMKCSVQIHIFLFMLKIKVQAVLMMQNILN